MVKTNKNCKKVSFAPDPWHFWEVAWGPLGRRVQAPGFARAARPWGCWSRGSAWGSAGWGCRPGWRGLWASEPICSWRARGTRFNRKQFPFYLFEKTNGLNQLNVHTWKKKVEALVKVGNFKSILVPLWIKNRVLESSPAFFQAVIKPFLNQKWFSIESGPWNRTKFCML